MPAVYYHKGTLTIEWLALSSVRYDREQVEYLLPLLPSMREGDYPPEPGGETDGGGNHNKHTAPYEPACQVAAELDRRLAQLGLDRYLVEDRYCAAMTLREIHAKTGLEEFEIDRRLRSALVYISSGPCPRWLDCLACGQWKTCTSKKRGRRPQTYKQFRKDRSSVANGN